MKFRIRSIEEMRLILPNKVRNFKSKLNLMKNEPDHLFNIGDHIDGHQMLNSKESKISS